jgi:hypothetical protein
VIALSAASDVVGGYQDSLSSEVKESSSRSEPKDEEPFSLVIAKHEEKQEIISREAQDEEQVKQKKRRIKNHV